MTVGLALAVRCVVSMRPALASRAIAPARTRISARLGARSKRGPAEAAAADNLRATPIWVTLLRIVEWRRSACPPPGVDVRAYTPERGRVARAKVRAKARQRGRGVGARGESSRLSDPKMLLRGARAPAGLRSGRARMRGVPASAPGRAARPCPALLTGVLVRLAGRARPRRSTAAPGQAIDRDRRARGARRRAGRSQKLQSKLKASRPLTGRVGGSPVDNRALARERGVVGDRQRHLATGRPPRALLVEPPSRPSSTPGAATRSRESAAG